MNLDVNGIRLTGQRFGVGRYVEYLLRCWSTQDVPFDSVRLFTPREVEGFPIPPFVDHRVIRTRLPLAWWEQVVLARQHHRDDLLFCPSYVVPVAARGKIVVTHLGSYEGMPEAFPWHERMKTRLLYAASARRASLVITVSESSKSDIVRFYGLAPEKVRVIPLGVDASFRPLDHFDLPAVRARVFGHDRPYILFVGKLTRRRNIPELVEAFARLKRERALPHGLLLVGADSAGHDVAKLAAAYGVSPDVRHLEYEDHSALVELYNAADLFVYPSSYEGFGIPVLEAMACGTPAITLRNTAFLEFAGGTYLAKDASVDELVRAMDEVLTSPDLRARLRQDGVIRARDFLWDGIARRTMETLTEVARS